MNPNSLVQAAVATINEAIALLTSRHSIDRAKAERFVRQQFEFMNADPNGIISAQRIVERYESSISRRDGEKSAVRAKIAKLIFKGLVQHASTESMPYYQLQSAFQSATGESLSQYAEDVIAVVDQLQNMEYIRWETLRNRGPLIFQGIDFDEWSKTMAREKDTVGSVTYNVNGANARINHHSTDLSTNVVGESPGILDQLQALRRAIKMTQVSDSERQSALEVADTVEAQFATGTPKKSVVMALLSALPKVADVATIAGTIIALMK